MPKNVNISHMSFKLNCRYYSQVSYKKNLDLYLKLKFGKKTIFQAPKSDSRLLLESLSYLETSKNKSITKILSFKITL